MNLLREPPLVGATRRKKSPSTPILPGVGLVDPAGDLVEPDCVDTLTRATPVVRAGDLV
jgi:hypothetical protein